MNHLEAYKLLRDNGFKVSVGTARGSEAAVSVNAFNKTDEFGKNCGVVVRVDADSIEEGLVTAATKLNEQIIVMRKCAEYVGEDDFADWVFL